MRRRLRGIAIVVAGINAAGAHAGPPFQTDDPEPVDRGHAEVNVIWQSTRSASGRDGGVSGELNVGCAAQTQCHVAVPLAIVHPADGPRRAGLGDAELGVKYRFVGDAGSAWSAATYPTVFLPTGDAGRGLGNGRAQLLLPLWVQRSAGAWHLDAGASLLVNPAPGARDVWYTGFLAQRSFGDALSVGAEVFRRSAPAAGEQASSGFNVGAIAKLAARQNLLFALGHGLDNVDANRSSIFLAWQLEQ